MEYLIHFWWISSVKSWLSFDYNSACVDTESVLSNDYSEFDYALQAEVWFKCLLQYTQT